MSTQDINNKTVDIDYIGDMFNYMQLTAMPCTFFIIDKWL